MGIELRQLRRIQQSLAADIAHPQQPIEPALPVALEVIARGVGIDRQGVGNIGSGTPLPSKITTLIRYAARTSRAARWAARSSASSCTVSR
jgi:hypothetical protein